LAEKWGPTAPFKLALVLLVSGGLIIFKTWEENYGHSESLQFGLKESFRLLRERKVLMTGIVQAFYESSLYIFVFMWSPSLRNSTPFNVLFGWVFSSFMVYCL
jgi:hypothetical protein